MNPTKSQGHASALDTNWYGMSGLVLHALLAFLPHVFLVTVQALLARAPLQVLVLVNIPFGSDYIAFGGGHGDTGTAHPALVPRLLGSAM